MPDEPAPMIAAVGNVVAVTAGRMNMTLASLYGTGPLDRSAGRTSCTERRDAVVAASAVVAGRYAGVRQPTTARAPHEVDADDREREREQEAGLLVEELARDEPRDERCPDADRDRHPDAHRVAPGQRQAGEPADDEADQAQDEEIAEQFHDPRAYPTRPSATPGRRGRRAAAARRGRCRRPRRSGGPRRARRG